LAWTLCFSCLWILPTGNYNHHCNVNKVLQHSWQKQKITDEYGSHYTTKDGFRSQ
jgi:hypothetical protein